MAKVFLDTDMFTRATNCKDRSAKNSYIYIIPGLQNLHVVGKKKYDDLSLDKLSIFVH